jgi:hypothetical protein
MARQAPNYAVKSVDGPKDRVPDYYKRRFRVSHVRDIEAGECPISLRGITLHGHVPCYAEVIEWFHQVRALGLENNIFYSGIAIQYWIRTEFPTDSIEHDFISNIVIDHATWLGEFGPTE